MQANRYISLNNLVINQSAEIVSLDKDIEGVSHFLHSMGIYPGMNIKLFNVPSLSKNAKVFENDHGLIVLSNDVTTFIKCRIFPMIDL
jgi:Fe2+ transport system protein FeoA